MIKIERAPCPNQEALKRDYKNPENKVALGKSSYGKCMYCESKIAHIDFAHVEHIKPKAEDKYPELKYDWDNLGYACPKCNNAKSDNYYVDTPYINPYREDPEQFLTFFGAYLLPKNGSERAELTIIDIELNRAELVSKRQEKINDLMKAINAANRTSNVALKKIALELLQIESDKSKEYSLLSKMLLINIEN